jgi:hypothetical protein
MGSQDMIGNSHHLKIDPEDAKASVKALERKVLEECCNRAFPSSHADVTLALIYFTQSPF